MFRDSNEYTWSPYSGRVVCNFRKGKGKNNSDNIRRNYIVLNNKFESLKRRTRRKIADKKTNIMDTSGRL